MDPQTRYERAFIEGELDPFDFILAENLHMTVAEMRDRMGNDEYLQWRAFYVWRAAERELAAKTATANRGQR